MAMCGFIFDIIVVRIDAPNYQFEDTNLLAVDVNFNNVNLSITSSRINVVEFRSGRSYEFESTPDDLRGDLEVTPLKLKVTYKDDFIGEGEMVWPDTILNKINEAQGELTHVDECDLIIDEEKVGSIEIIVRLQVKCQEITNDDYPKSGDDIRRHLDKVIDPHDILFVVSNPKKNDECAGLMNSDSNELQQQDRHTTALDLSFYRTINGRLIQTPDVINACMNTDCCEVKKMSNQYQSMIDSILKSDREPERACRASVHCEECPHENKFSSSSVANSSDCKIPEIYSNDKCDIPDPRKFSGCFADTHDQTTENYDCEKLSNICGLGQQIMTTIAKPTKRCPICRENITWLPNYIPCPKCGFKAIPCAEEKPYNAKRTADEVLKDYLDKKSSEHCKEENGKDKVEKKECRCTCKFGKVCAHCRIRKLCEDIFPTMSKPVVKAQPVSDCGKCEESDLYNICKSSSKECRPYLSRVFSELRDLYDIKDPKTKGFVFDQRCEKIMSKRSPRINKNKTKSPRSPRCKVTQKSTRMNGAGVARKPSKPKSKKKIETAKPQQQQNFDRSLFLASNLENATKACRRKKKFYVKTDRKYPGVKIGHKYCYNGRKIVPKHMGWLWNLDDEVRRGWSPGAIRRPIKMIMKHFLKDFPTDTLRVSKYCFRNQGKGDFKETEEICEQKPTLHVCKKNDEYFITLRPLKDAEALKHCANPYLNMKPIQFKIIKNPMVAEIRNLKRCLKDMGFNKCTCHKPVVDCFCRNFLDKKRLEYQLQKECRKRKIPTCNDSLVLSDTSESDVEFDFGVTPPAGVMKPERLNKPNLVNHGTQYIQGDCNPLPFGPKPMNRYMKMCNCCTGLRYSGGRKKKPEPEEKPAAGPAARGKGAKGGATRGGPAAKGKK